MTDGYKAYHNALELGSELTLRAIYVPNFQRTGAVDRQEYSRHLARYGNWSGNIHRLREVSKNQRLLAQLKARLPEPRGVFMRPPHWISFARQPPQLPILPDSGIMLSARQRLGSRPSIRLGSSMPSSFPHVLTERVRSGRVKKISPSARSVTAEKTKILGL